MSEVDPSIKLIFGPPAVGVDLNESTTAAYDIVSCVVLGIAAAAVCLRFYVRTMRGANSLAIDDWFVVLGLVSPALSLIAMTSFCIFHDSSYTPNKKVNTLFLTQGFDRSVLLPWWLQHLLVGAPKLSSDILALPGDFD